MQKLSFFQYVCIAADHVSENALLYRLCFNIALDLIGVVSKRTMGLFSGTNFDPVSFKAPLK